MREWWRELRYGARVLARAPGFTAVAVLSLALGIGVNAAVLAVARGVLLQPLPVPQPEQLVVAGWAADGVKRAVQLNSGAVRHPRTGVDLRTNFSYPMYEAFRESLAPSADVFAFTFMRQANISVGGQPVMGGGMLVSGSYFAGIRAPLAAGRGIDDGDDRAGAERVAVIGHALWQRAFGGDPAALGRIVKVNGHPFTVVGITARGFFGVSNGGFFPPADITLPLSTQPLVSPRWTALRGSLFTSPDVLWLRVMARLDPDADVARVQQAALGILTQSLAATGTPAFAGARNADVALLPGLRGLDSMRASLQKPLSMLAAVALLVFLVACVNVASLVLARGLVRQQEFRVRLALGAGRMRLVRQTFAEAVLLAAAGGVLGVALSAWAGRALVSTLAGATPNAIAVGVDFRLLAICAIAACAAALLSGALPAVRLSSNASADFVRQTGAGAAAPRLRAGRALVLVQIAVSVPLLVGAALFLRTIHNLAGVELGFDPRGVTIFRMDPGLNGYDEPRVKQLFARVLARLEREPGVERATLVENALVSGWTSSATITVDGGAEKSIWMNRVGPSFFETFGLPIVAGRGFGLHDRDGSPAVGVVNEAAVKQLFDGANPIGRELRMGSRSPVTIEIVGVARDSKYSSLQAANGPILFLPYFQSRGMSAMFVAIRGRAVGRWTEQIRAAAADVDPEVPATDIKTQTQQIEATLGSERAFTTLLTFFGGFALLLAGIGLHGVTSYTVARRTREIGIRMALGAQPHSVVWLMLRQVVILAAGGLLVGLPAAAWLSRSAEAFLYGVEAADPWSLVTGGAVLFVTAVAAGFLPSRRASRLDPLVALRTE